MTSLFDLERALKRAQKQSDAPTARAQQFSNSSSQQSISNNRFVALQQQLDAVRQKSGHQTAGAMGLAVASSRQVVAWSGQLNVEEYRGKIKSYNGKVGKIRDDRSDRLDVRFKSENVSKDITKPSEELKEGQEVKYELDYGEIQDAFKKDEPIVWIHGKSLTLASLELKKGIIVSLPTDKRSGTIKESNTNNIVKFTWANWDEDQPNQRKKKRSLRKNLKVEYKINLNTGDRVVGKTLKLTSVPVYLDRLKDFRASSQRIGYELECADITLRVRGKRFEDPETYGQPILITDQFCNLEKSTIEVPPFPIQTDSTKPDFDKDNFKYVNFEYFASEDGIYLDTRNGLFELLRHRDVLYKKFPVIAVTLEEQKEREDPKIEVVTAPIGGLANLRKLKTTVNKLLSMADGKTAQQWAAAANARGDLAFQSTGSGDIKATWQAEGVLHPVMAYGCSFVEVQARNEKERSEMLAKFKRGYKDDDCTVLMLNSERRPTRWTVAGFDDKGKFKSVEIENPNDELLVEWNKDIPSVQKLITLSTKHIGRTPTVRLPKAKFSKKANAEGSRLLQTNVDVYLHQFYQAPELLRSMILDEARLGIFNAVWEEVDLWKHNAAQLSAAADPRHYVAGLLTWSVYQAICEYLFGHGKPNLGNKEITQPTLKVGVDVLARVGLTQQEQGKLLEIARRIVNEDSKSWIKSLKRIRDTQTREKISNPGLTPNTDRDQFFSEHGDGRINGLIEYIKCMFLQWFLVPLHSFDNTKAAIVTKDDWDEASKNNDLLLGVGVDEDSKQFRFEKLIKALPADNTGFDKLLVTSSKRVDSLGNGVNWDASGGGMCHTGKAIQPIVSAKKTMVVVEVRKDQAHFNKLFYHKL